MFPSLYLLPAGQVPCLRSVLLCMSSSFWQLGWRSSLHLGLVALREKEKSKSRQCDSTRSSVQVWHTSLIGFIRTKDRMLCVCPFPTQIHIFTLLYHVLQYIERLSVLLDEWLRYMMYELSVMTLEWSMCSSSSGVPPCVCSTRDHILPSLMC